MSDLVLARSAYGLFCEDIRHEQAGQVSLVGVFPTRIRVKVFPFSFPKFVAYAALAFPIADPPKKIVIDVTGPWQSDPILRLEVQPSEGETEIIKVSAGEIPQDATMFEMRFSPTGLGVEIPKAGRITGIIYMDDQPYPPFVLRIDGLDAPASPAGVHLQTPPGPSKGTFTDTPLE